MIISTLNILSDDKYILAMDLLVRVFLRGLLPIKHSWSLVLNVPSYSLLSKRLLMEPGCYPLFKPEIQYEQYIQDCFTHQDIYPILLISGLAPHGREPQLISRCVEDGRWDVLEQLVCDGLDLIGWAWKLAGSQPTRKLRKLLNRQLRGRLSQVTIGDEGDLILMLARHQVSGDFCHYIRYLPFLGTSTPFALLQSIHHTTTTTN